MTELNKENLRASLLEVGYPDTQLTDNAVEHLLQLKGKAAELLLVWFETGRVAKFEAIEGIDRNFLRDKLKMKDPAIIMAYGMLLENPQYNAMLFKRKAFAFNK